MSQNNSEEEDKPGKTVRPITPPNLLKTKVGFGSFDKEMIEKAQKAIDENEVDYKPIGLDLLKIATVATENMKSGVMEDHAAINSITDPMMQLKAQGTMFHYPLVTDMSYSLIDFLENIEAIDEKVIELIEVHNNSIQAILNNEIKDPESPIGKQIYNELVKACNRYNKTRKT